MEGTLHVYHPTRSLLLFEHTPKPTTPSPTSADTPSTPPPNTLLFIGGMYDNFLSPGYTTALSSLFPHHPTQTWSLMHVQLSSAGKSFGVSSLSKDAEEIATAIKYIRSTLRPSTPGNIVLLGHSTGCQDVLHYLSAPNPSAPNKPTRPAVQGAILQAPVSDRDQATYLCSTNPDTKSLHDQALNLATSTPSSQHRTTLLPIHLTTPLFGPAPLSVSRFLSLLSPSSPDTPGPDDLFSHDATELHLKSTFGSIGPTSLLRPTPSSGSKPSLLTLMSGEDEYVPSHIAKAALLTRWRTAMRGTGCTLHGGSAIVEGGNHALDGEDEDGITARLVVFRGAVLDYLDEMVGEVDEGAWDVWARGRDGIGHEKEEDEKGAVEKGVSGLKL